MVDDRDTILNRMLQNISDEYDKTEGSFFYDVIKSVAIELEDAYKNLSDVPDKFFIENATGMNLDLRVVEQGITRKQATKATTFVTITGANGAIITEGDLVASDIVNFVVKETKIIDETGATDVLVECEQAGIIGNVPIGTIKYFPVTISGLNTVINNQTITNGYDGETDEELRQRYYEKVRTPATSGNKYHYKNWAKEVPGVGDARVFPLANGPGTVKLVIIDSNKTGVEAQLVTDVFNHIEEVRPIGATVTVESALEISISISVTLNIDLDNYNEIEVISNIESNIIKYLKDIAFIEDYISYAKIGSTILATEGVIDYSNLLINDVASNIVIANNEIAVLGGVTNV